MNRETTGPAKCYFEKLLQEVVLRRISESIECISLEIFVNIPSTRSIRQHRFLRQIHPHPHILRVLQNAFSYQVTERYVIKLGKKQNTDYM